MALLYAFVRRRQLQSGAHADSSVNHSAPACTGTRYDTCAEALCASVQTQGRQSQLKLVGDIHVVHGVGLLVQRNNTDHEQPVCTVPILKHVQGAEIGGSSMSIGHKGVECHPCDAEAEDDRRTDCSYAGGELVVAAKGRVIQAMHQAYFQQDALLSTEAARTAVPECAPANQSLETGDGSEAGVYCRSARTGSRKHT